MPCYRLDWRLLFLKEMKVYTQIAICKRNVTIFKKLHFLNFRAKNFGGKITTNHFSQELHFRNGFITCSVTIYDFLKNCNVNVTFCMGFQSRDLFSKT